MELCCLEYLPYDQYLLFTERSVIIWGDSGVGTVLLSSDMNSRGEQKAFARRAKSRRIAGSARDELRAATAYLSCPVKDTIPSPRPFRRFPGYV